MISAIPQEVLAVLSLLEQNGYEAYIVGGAVRNLLMGVTPNDWDITTNALPRQTAGVFADYRVVETGIKHGTVTVILQDMPLEITTYRSDGAYTDHRRPDSVCFVSSLHEDLARRDFTMNALAYHPDRGLVDDFGGREDIARRTIRAVGNPEQRFTEDALRILRAVRFAAVFGYKIEENTAAAMHKLASLLQNISAERIREELTKLLCGSYASEILQEYRDVIAAVIPELAATFDFDQKNPHHKYDIWAHLCCTVKNAIPSPLIRWAALLHDVGKPACFTTDDNGVGHFYGHPEFSERIAEEILPRLRFDNKSTETLLYLIRCHDIALSDNEKGMRRLILKHGIERLLLLLEVKKADAASLGTESSGNDAFFNGYAEKCRTLYEAMRAENEKPTLCINGNDLLALGLEGRAVGKALRLLTDAVFADGLPNEKEILTDYLKRKGII